MATLALRLDIRILHQLKVQQFLIPLDLTGPATLEIKLGQYALGNEISILDIEGEKRVWYASKIHQIKFEYVEEEDVERATQGYEKVGTLWEVDRHP